MQSLHIRNLKVKELAFLEQDFVALDIFYTQPSPMKN